LPACQAAGVTEPIPAPQQSQPPRWRLLALAPLGPDVLAGLVRELPIDVAAPAAPTAEAIEAELAGADLLLGDWRTSTPGLSAAAVERARRLAFVQQPSVGVQAHDGEALARAGVPLANVAGFNAGSVAEWVVGATLTVARSLAWTERELLAGRWPQVEVIDRLSVEIAGRRVGVLGYGPVGHETARRFAALDCPVSYWSRRRRPPGEAVGGYRELDDLIGWSDVLVVTLPLADGTRGLLDADRLRRLPAGALLVVASRGGIVDEDAVAALLADGRLAGAAFDVYASEPLPADSPLRTAERVLLTPHIAGNTAQSSVRLVKAVAANLRRAVTGEPVADVVNGVDPVVRRRG
jgi:phosphoglycerate dehydrogenase-like enzyme